MMTFFLVGYFVLMIVFGAIYLGTARELVRADASPWKVYPIAIICTILWPLAAVFWTVYAAWSFYSMRP